MEEVSSGDNTQQTNTVAPTRPYCAQTAFGWIRPNHFQPGPDQHMNHGTPTLSYLAPVPVRSGWLRPNDSQQGPVHRSHLWISSPSWCTPEQSLHEPMVHSHNGTGGSASQPTILIPELHIQQAEARATQNNMLKRENEAFTIEIMNLQEVLKMKKVLHDEALLDSEIKIKDLELELLEIAASEAEALSNLVKTQEALEKQQENQKEEEMHLVRVTKENHRLTAALVESRRELECQRQQLQEERSHLFQSLSDIQQVLQERERTREARLQDMKERINNAEEELKKEKRRRRPKNPFVWKRLTQSLK